MTLLRWIISIFLLLVMLEQFGFPLWRTFGVGEPVDLPTWLGTHGTAWGIALSFYLVRRLQHRIFSRVDRLLLLLIVLFFAFISGISIWNMVHGLPLVEYKQGVYHVRFLAPIIGGLVGLNIWLTWREVRDARDFH